MHLFAMIKLLRLHHCVKNLFVFCPLFFHKRFFEPSLLIPAIVSFLAFTCLASAVYVINDIYDAPRDMRHPTKRVRSIASRQVTIMEARILSGVLLLIAVSLLFFTNAPWVLLGYTMLYLGMNLGYSFSLKNYPVIDVGILASGFLLRVLFGSAATGVEISHWLALTVLMGALYLGLGKRRNELRRIQGTRTRRVLRFYTVDFLDRHMYLCLGLALTFYALWSIAQETTGLIWTVPLVLLILMRYNLAIERESDGDPVEVILGDRILLGLGILYGIVLIALLYFPVEAL